MTDNNTKRHPLHKNIGCLLSKFQSGNANIEVFLDEACDISDINKRKQQISLFVGNVKNRESRLCKVDAMIVQDGYCKIIVEIEESGFIPTKICGKYLTTALSTHYLRDDKKIELDKKGVFFVQVLNAGGFTEEKKAQLRIIEGKLQKILFDRATQYKLYLIDSNNPDFAELEQGITKLLQNK